MGDFKTRLRRANSKPWSRIIILHRELRFQPHIGESRGYETLFPPTGAKVFLIIGKQSVSAYGHLTLAAHSLIANDSQCVDNGAKWSTDLICTRWNRFVSTRKKRIHFSSQGSLLKLIYPEFGHRMRLQLIIKFG